MSFFCKSVIFCKYINSVSLLFSLFYLVKGIYKLKKSDLKYNNDIDSIVHYCYDMNFRMMWDEAIKSVEKYEGNDYSYIVCTWGKSPVFFVSERETIEKRFLFKKEDIIYIMSTSIPLTIPRLFPKGSSNDPHDSWNVSHGSA